jgi:hypothetical protein
MIIKLCLIAITENNKIMLKLKEQGLIDILQTLNSYANCNSKYECIYVDMKMIDNDE